MQQRFVSTLHSLKISLFFSACTLVLLTTGCVRYLPFYSTPATIVNTELYFKSIRKLPPQLIEKLPSDIVYYTPSPDIDEYADPSNFSNVIYNHLSLNFLWTGAKHKQRSFSRTYAAMPSSGQFAIHDATKLSITNEFTKETFSLLAVLDWDNTGTTDWLVLYTFKSLVQPENCTRLLLVRDIEQNRMLNATVLSATECYGKTCKDYSGDKLVDFLGYDPVL